MHITNERGERMTYAVTQRRLPSNDITDQRFPVKFPRPRLVDDERFLLIVKNGFPKKLSLKVLQHRVKVPFRNLTEESDDAIPSEQMRKPLPPIQTKLVTYNSEPVLRPIEGATTNSRPNSQQGKLRQEYISNIIREKTFYPYGWPRTKTGVKNLKTAKVGHAERIDNLKPVEALRKRQVKVKSSPQKSPSNRSHEMVGCISVDTDIVKLGRVQEISENSLISTMHGVTVDYSTSAEASSNLRTPQTPAQRSRSPLVTSQVTFGKSQVTDHKSVQLPHIQKSNDKTKPLTANFRSDDISMSTGVQTETLAHNKQTRRMNQIKLPALNMKSNQNLPVNTMDKVSSYYKPQHNLLRVQKTKQSKKEGLNLQFPKTGVTERKPVISNACQLQDLVQLEHLDKQKPVDPYSVYLKYHGTKQVIDCSTYQRHARRTTTKRSIDCD